VAGRRDFAHDEWATMQRAMLAGAMLVSLADGSVDREELHALTMDLRDARFSHRSQLVHELADVPPLKTEPRTPATYAAYRAGAIETIRSAVDILAAKAPAELRDFQEFVVRLAEAVADANLKGDILGAGRVRRTPDEVAAIEAVKQALGFR
jgi:hypothetical protein